MKIMFIRLFKKKNNDVMMKHLRTDKKIKDSRHIPKHRGSKYDAINRLEKMKSENEIQNKTKSNKLFNYDTAREEKIDYNKEELIKRKLLNDKKENKLIKFNNDIGVANFMEKLHEMGKKTPIKRKQVATFTLSLMLVAAGYFNYTNNIKYADLGDAQLVASQEVTNEEAEKLKAVENKTSKETGTNTIINSISETQNVSENKNSENNKDDYFTETKLKRNKMYSEMIETYTKILENSQIPETQKAIATNEIKTINDKNAKIKTIENLLKTKNFEDSVVLINDKTIDVVIKSQDNLKKEQVAQIQNIVSRELSSEISDIHITTHI